MKLTLEEANRLMAGNGGSLDLHGAPVTSLPEGLSVGGSLYLGDTRVASLPKGLSVGGSLDLHGTPIASLPEGLKVGSWLNLDNTRVTSLPDNLAIGGSLNLRGTPIASLPAGLSVGGSLELRGTRVTSLPKGLTIGGSLYLGDTGIASLPEDLAVGGSLYLYGTRVMSLPESLAIGGQLCMDGTEPQVRKLRDGDYVPGRYIYADGILTHVKSEKRLDGYVIYVGKIKGRNVVTDGERYAHCDRIRDGIADLTFKAAADRGADQYKSLSLDSEVSLDEAKAMYRIVTGACRQGTDDFVARLGDGLKPRYTVREVLELTKGQYGYEKFAEFFKQ